MSEDEKILKEAKKLPWEERLAHKNWKVRNEANIDLAALCDSILDPKDPRLKEFGPLFKKSVSDANAPTQEKALDALMAYLRAADVDATRYAKEICDAIVSKCLTGRPKTIEKSQAVFLLWVELEAADVFLDAMEKAIKNKVAKAVVPAIDAVYQAVSSFGTRVIPPKRILRMLPELFDHQDQNVRACAKGLTVEMCRWIGQDTVKSVLFEKMRDTMKKELEVEVDTVSGVSRPSRKIRSEQVKESEPEIVVQCEQVGETYASSNGGATDIDEYDLMDPVDILTPLGKSSFWEGVKASKWSERRDAVGELTKFASAKRLCVADYSEVCRTLKKLITDVNIAVAVEAVQAAGNLARGLRKDFTGGARLLLPLLLDKLKEKKQVMVDALTQTLQSMHKGGSVQLMEIVEEVKTATKNKVPSVRSLCLTWLTTCIETSSKANVLKIHKEYVPIFMECLTDGTPEVRDAAFSALAAVAKLVGMKPLERSLEKLDEVRKKKLTDMIGPSGAGSGPASAGAPSRFAAITPVNGEAAENVATKSAASLLSGKKHLAITSASANVTKKAATARPSTAKKSDFGAKAPLATDAVEDVEAGMLSLEEIEARVGVLVPEDLILNMKSSNWKERLEAITAFKDVVESIADVQQHVELLVRLICVLPGWAEKNVQVQQKAIEIITHVAQNYVFSKRCVVLCVAGVAERVSDVKTRLQATKCLTVFCESVGPQFVFDRLYKIMREHKNPKVLSECLLWLVTAVEDFGVTQVKTKELIDFCKEVGLQSSAAASRNATVKLIGVLHKFVGPDIKPFLSDVKPALQSTLDTEFEKNPYEGPVLAAKRAVRAGGVDVFGSGDGVDGLPREDISGKITAQLLKNLSAPEWKVRQESIENVNNIIEEAHKRIQGTGIGELFGALKSRLNDSNKNLIIMTLCTIGNLSSALGCGVEKCSKGILAEVLKCLADNKKLMREAVVKTLDSWATVVSLDKMLPVIVSNLIDPKICSDGRKDLYDWLTKQIGKLPDQPELTQLVKPISAGLQDKSADVRKAAEACLVEIFKACGTELVMKVSKELQGTALAAVQPILERYKVSGDAVEDLSSKGGKVKSTKQILNTASGDRPVSRGSSTGPARGLAKVMAVKVSKQGAAAAAQDAAVQGQALFQLKDSNKEERGKAMPRRTKFEDLRPDQIQELENEMIRHYREDLHRRLLSPDFKKQVDGLDLLQKAIPTHVKDIIEVLDILLRWCVLRLCESNTTCLVKVLEFLLELVEALKNYGYTLTEYESSVFLPCVVEKSGHNIEKVREKMRELTKALCCVYPASKVFLFISEGLRSKNNKTRIESVDHIGFMVERYGIEVAGATKVLQHVAALTTERDSEIRKAALQTLAVSYKILGDDIWKFVGKVSDAQKSILDDKFKWKAREMSKKKEGKPGEVRATLRRSVRENGLDTAESSGEGFRPLTAPAVVPSARVVSMLVDSSSDLPFIAQPVVQSSGPSGGPGDWTEALDIIEFGTTAEQFVEGMKFVCHELGQASVDTENRALDDLGKDADRLVSNLTVKVTTTFNLGLSGESSRSCKYVLNTLMQTFQVKKLAAEVKEATLHNLITELLLWLLDERVPLMDDGSQLLKALNVLMLKILENANRTSAFLVLIYLLRPLNSARANSSPAEQAILLRGQKFSDLVVKCLIKLTKVLASTIYEVDLDRLLQSIHEYLQELGLEEIRRRAGADDKPLRMVKTVLHELVKLRGTAIKGHLSMVPIDIEPQPIILAYIDLNLQTLAAARMLTPTGSTGQVHWPESTSNGPATPAGHFAEAQLKQELAAVFKKIGDKQTSAIGLYELYRITQLYPQVDIFAQLHNASEAFRAYIRDGLTQMGKNSSSGRTPGNVAFVAPPPVSPTHGFSKAVPASPNSLRLHPVVTGSMESGYVGINHGEEMENTRYAKLSDSDAKKVTYVRRHERDWSDAKGTVPAQAGTLDAIRERMKSIQAAAAGSKVGNSYSNGSHALLYACTEQGTEAGPRTVLSQNVPAMDERALSGLQERMARLKSGTVDQLSFGT